MTSSTSRPDWVAYSALAVMPLMFSSNLVIGRAASDALAPSTLAFWRWSIAATVLCVFAAPAIWRHRSAIMDALPQIVMLGFLGMVVCGTFVYVSLQHTTATNGTLIYTTSPVFIILLERIFRGRRTRLREAAGILIALFGIFAIITRMDIDIVRDVRFNAGDLGMLVAAISWAIYSVVLRSRAIAVLPTKVSFAAIAVAGALIVAPSWILEGMRSAYLPRSGEAWASVFGVALFASVFAFSLYQFGLKRAGPTVASIFMYLLPVYGVGMSVVFLGEALAFYHAFGVGLVLAGVVLATLPNLSLSSRRKTTA